MFAYTSGQSSKKEGEGVVRFINTSESKDSGTVIFGTTVEPDSSAEDLKGAANAAVALLGEKEFDFENQENNGHSMFLISKGYTEVKIGAQKTAHPRNICAPMPADYALPRGIEFVPTFAILKTNDKVASTSAGSSLDNDRSFETIKRREIEGQKVLHVFTQFAF